MFIFQTAQTQTETPRMEPGLANMIGSLSKISNINALVNGPYGKGLEGELRNERNLVKGAYMLTKADRTSPTDIENVAKYQAAARILKLPITENGMSEKDAGMAADRHVIKIAKEAFSTLNEIRNEFRDEYSTLRNMKSEFFTDSKGELQMVTEAFAHSMKNTSYQPEKTSYLSTALGEKFDSKCATELFIQLAGEVGLKLIEVKSQDQYVEYAPGNNAPSETKISYYIDVTKLLGVKDFKFQNEEQKELIMVPKEKWESAHPASDSSNKTVEQTPTHFGVYLDRADAKYKSGDYKGAIEDYDKAIELTKGFKSNMSDYLVKRASANERLERYSDAIADYDKAIERNPENQSAYFNRALVKNSLKDYTGAIADYSKVIELDPKNADAFNNRGIAKGELKDRAGAKEDLKEADRISKGK